VLVPALGSTPSRSFHISGDRAEVDDDVSSARRHPVLAGRRGARSAGSEIPRGVPTKRWSTVVVSGSRFEITRGPDVVIRHASGSVPTSRGRERHPSTKVRKTEWHDSEIE
jgi:hypothetical protein